MKERLLKLMKERKIKFVGIGQMPINQITNTIDWEVWDLLIDLLVEEGNWNPTLGDGIPEDARFPATDYIEKVSEK